MLIQKTRKSLSFLYSDLHCYAHRKSTVFFSCHISRIHLCKMKDSRVVPVGVHCASLRSEHEEGVLAMYAYSVTSTLRAEKPSRPAYVTFVLRDPLCNGSEALQAAVHEWKRITVDGKGDASFISFSTLSMCVIGVLSKQGGAVGDGCLERRLAAIARQYEDGSVYYESFGHYPSSPKLTGPTALPLNFVATFRCPRYEFHFEYDVFLVSQ
jgi:hypothetical protein